VASDRLFQTVPVDVLPWETQYGGARQGPTYLPGGGVIPAPPMRMPVVQPYYEIKPPSGLDFYFNEVGVLAAGAGSILVVPAAGPIQLNTMYEGVIKSVTIFVDAPTALLDVDFGLRVAGSLIPGWDRLRSFPRAANNLSIGFGGTVQIPAGVAIDVLITNRSAAGPWTVGAEVTGWSWPMADRRRVFGEDS